MHKPEGRRERDQSRGGDHQLDDTIRARHHELINGSRRKRIARGSGTNVQQVNQLLKQYAQMRKMFKSMGKPSFARRLAGMKMPGCRRKLSVVGGQEEVDGG